MKRILISALFGCALSVAYSQTIPRSPQDLMELGVSEPSLIDRLMVIVPGVGGTTREMLSQQSIKSYMMPVRKVGVRGSELSYTLATCLEFYVNLGKNYKDNLSPDYVSLSIENAGRQVSVEEAFRFLAQNGTISAAILPYDAAQITSAIYSAAKYRISNYLIIFREITQARQRVYEARKALLRGNPVMVELRADESVKTFQGRQWKPVRADDKLYPMVVVGFDENAQAFEVLSCWGSQWGDGGYAWISYDDFGKNAVNGYVMVPLPQY
jgi:hypothetical protein